MARDIRLGILAATHARILRIDIGNRQAHHLEQLHGERPEEKAADEAKKEKDTVPKVQ